MATTETDHRDPEKHSADIEGTSDNVHNETSNKNSTFIPENDEQYVVTLKTWIVVGILALSYGISFWIVPALSAAQAVVATQLGTPSDAAWFVPIYTMTVTLAFMYVPQWIGHFLQLTTLGSVAPTLIYLDVAGSLSAGTCFSSSASSSAAQPRTPPRSSWPAPLSVSCVTRRDHFTLADLAGCWKRPIGSFRPPRAAAQQMETLSYCPRWYVSPKASSRKLLMIIPDIGVYFAVIVGPVAGRFSIEHGDDVSFFPPILRSRY